MEKMSLEKELTDVDDAIKELLQQKDGELNINYKKPQREKKERKRTIDKNFRDKLKRKKSEEVKLNLNKVSLISNRYFSHFL